MIKCKFFDNKKWLTKDKKSENTYQNVLAVFIYYWRIYFLSTQSTFKQTFTSMYFFCTFFMSKSLFSIKTKCLKKCLKSRIFTLLVVVATLHMLYLSDSNGSGNLLRINSVSLTNSHTRHGASVEINPPAVLSSIHSPTLGRV